MEQSEVITLSVGIVISVIGWLINRNVNQIDTPSGAWV